MWTRMTGQTTRREIRVKQTNQTAIFKWINCQLVTLCQWSSESYHGDAIPRDWQWNLCKVLLSTSHEERLIESEVVLTWFKNCELPDELLYRSFFLFSVPGFKPLVASASLQKSLKKNIITFCREVRWHSSHSDAYILKSVCLLALIKTLFERSQIFLCFGSKMISVEIHLVPHDHFFLIVSFFLSCT